jgi:hypothetical protein
MSVEPDKKRVVELEQRVKDLESKVTEIDIPPRIVPKAMAVVRVGLVLCCITILIGVCATFTYFSYRPSFLALLVVSVPFVVSPLILTLYGYQIFRNLRRGTRKSERFAIAGIWMSLPILLVGNGMMFMLGLARWQQLDWPHLDFVMLLTLLYTVTEVLFVSAGIMVWRARKAASTIT